MDNSTDGPIPNRGSDGEGAEETATSLWAAAACHPQLEDGCPWTASATKSRLDTPPPPAAARLLEGSIEELAEHERTATELMNLLRRAG